MLREKSTSPEFLKLAPRFEILPSPRSGGQTYYLFFITLINKNLSLI